MEKAKRKEPQGFGEHPRKVSYEHAHEQGWGPNEDERRRLAEGKQDDEGGTDYDDGRAILATARQTRAKRKRAETAGPGAQAGPLLQERIRVLRSGGDKGPHGWSGREPADAGA